MDEWGIFNNESADYTSDEAIEADFWSRGEAEAALKERYSGEGDEDCHVHKIEEEDDFDDDEDFDDDDDSDLDDSDVEGVEDDMDDAA